MTRLVVFLAVSALVLYASRLSLGRPRSHGFYRLFAWECLLGLILLNARTWSQWFHDPWSAHQIASWALLFGSLPPLGFGIAHLRASGRAETDSRRDPSLFAFERTTELVTTGIFRYIRHPLYTSLLLLIWGVFFKRGSVPGFALALGASLFLFLTAVTEERENVAYFGPAYRTYMERTRRFIPFLF